MVTRIEPNEAVFVASESRGAGTEAEVLYTGQLDVGSGRKAQVMLMLQWFNPKIADKLGKSTSASRRRGKDKNNHRASRGHRSIYLLFLAAGRSMS